MTVTAHPETGSHLKGDIVSDPRTAALLFAHARPETQAETEAFAAQQLACQLYAGNHDLIIIGLCDVIADEAADPAGTSMPPDEAKLPFVEPGDVDVVLAVAPSPDDAISARFAAALERLRAQQIDVLLVDRREE